MSFFNFSLIRLENLFNHHIFAMQILSTCYVKLDLLKYTQKESLTQETSDQTQKATDQAQNTTSKNRNSITS